MIIKRPENEHIPALTSLWMQAFGDSKDFIDCFFRTGFSYDRCLLAEAQGQLLAALYWFDCLWEDKKVAYLYAVATDADRRGKGICAELMKHTHRHLQKAGYAGAILVPADEGLARMYAKLGYRSVISPKPKAQIQIRNAQKGTDLSTPCFQHSAQDDIERVEALKMTTEIVTSTPITVEQYRTLQKSLLPENAVVHTDAAFLYLQSFAQFYKFPGGILCKTGDTVQEVLPYAPTGENMAMYLSLTEDKALPSYFALPLA